MPQIDTSVGRISYDDIGSGPPIVLLHATLHDRHDFDPIVPALAEANRVIAIDWPDHGLSDRIKPPAVATAELFADVLEEFVAELNLGPAVFIGNSVGGFAAGRFAIRKPDQVKGLVLVNAGGFAPLNPITVGYLRFKAMPTVMRRALPGSIDKYMLAASENDRAVATRAIERAHTEEGVKTAASMWKSFAASSHNLRPDAHKITAPTLLIWGSKDPVIPVWVGRAALRRIPGATMRTLPTGHVVFSSAAREFLDLVLPFIASTAAVG